MARFLAQQQSEFVPLFTNFIEDVYLSRMEQYSVEKVQQTVQIASVEFIRERIDAPDQAVVFSQVTLQDRGNPLDGELPDAARRQRLENL